MLIVTHSPSTARLLCPLLLAAAMFGCSDSHDDDGGDAADGGQVEGGAGRAGRGGSAAGGAGSAGRGGSAAGGGTGGARAGAGGSGGRATSGSGGGGGSAGAAGVPPDPDACMMDSDCGFGEIEHEILSSSDCPCLLGCPFIPQNQETLARRRAQYMALCEPRRDGQGQPCPIDDCVQLPDGMCVDGTCRGAR